MAQAMPIVAGNELRLPVISVRALRSGAPDQVRRVADAIGQAARQTGFFLFSDHGVDPALISATYEAAAAFFAQPDDVKQQWYIGHSANHRGYVPFSEKGDYADEVHRSYEAFDLGLDLPADDPDYLAGCRLLGPNVWPDVPGFRRTVSAYYDTLATLGRLVAGAVELHLGLPAGAMTQQMNKPVSQLRLLHYVRRTGAEQAQTVNMGAHTDYECLTLLHTGNKGLQVMTQEDRWIDVPADPALFVVNVGDMLEAWSNGLLRSTPHRVLNLSPERFSLPYFVAGNYDAVIRPFPALTSPLRPPLYAPFLAGAHLERMLMRDFPYLRRQRQTEDGTGPSRAALTNPFERRIAAESGSTCPP